MGALQLVSGEPGVPRGWQIKDKECLWLPMAPPAPKLGGSDQAKTGSGADSGTGCTVATGVPVRAIWSNRPGRITFQGGRAHLRLFNLRARSPAYCPSGGRAAWRCRGSAAALFLAESFRVTGCTPGRGGVAQASCSAPWIRVTDGGGGAQCGQRMRA